jgi:WD40 repeat protein/tRNA A-37 threonylcarbamoyl transferase component Bud32
MSYCLNPACPKPENPDDAIVCQSCGSGLRLGDRYRAIKLLGQGGFGRTFLAIDEARAFTQNLDSTDSLPSPCVIKQLLPRAPVANSAQAIDRFRQEAERLAALGEHTQIPKLLAHFEETEAQYLVQEYIDGDNLDTVLQQEGPFSEMAIRDLLADLLPVVRFVHSYQVIHRDIKPENIIRPRQGDRFVLVDFGASKYATEAVLTRTGTVIGSAGYAAPEQAMGRADFASDLYSLGITCIHLLTGLHPFDLYSVSEDRWVWQQYLPKPISGRLRRVLDKLLQKATSQRYRNATEVLQDLGLESSLKTFAPSPNGSSASRTRQPSRTAETETWQCVQTLAGHEGEVTALAISPGGRILASGSSDNAIRFWSLETGELLHTFAGRSLWAGGGHREGISTLAFSPDGETLASGSDDGTIKWWDLTTRRLIYTLPGHGWGISAISFNAKGYVLACGSRDGLIQIWDLDRERLITDLAKHQDQVSALVFVPQRRMLISSSYDKTICLWDLQTRELTKTLLGHVDRISSIAFSQNNRTLVSSSWDKTVKLWDLEFGEQRKVIAAHKRSVTCLALHPTQPVFASGSEDSTIKLWDVETGDRLSTLKNFWGINALVFSPNGQVLVSGGADELIKLWRKRS